MNEKQVIQLSLLIWELIGLVLIFSSARVRDVEGVLIHKYPSGTQWMAFFSWWSLPLILLIGD